MLSTGKHYLILSYAFFLAWLLSFLYNGPAIDILFSGHNINSGILALTYIVAPAVMLLGIGFMDVDKKWKNLFVRSGLIVCIFGTLSIFIMKDTVDPMVSYVFAGILGIYSVLFITGWGCYFVEVLDVKFMWKSMGIVICLGNVIFNINSMLKANGYYTAIILVLFICLGIALYTSEGLIRKSVSIPKNFGMTLSPRVLGILCIFVFLLNLGGGILHTLIGPMAREFYANVHMLDLLIYMTLGITLVIMKRKLEIETTLTISMMLIACGYLFIILVGGNPLPGYILTVVGYAIFDVMIWTLVGEMGYVFGKPVKIFAYVMSANLFAVFGGNLMGAILSDTEEHIYIAITITAISIIIGFVFLPKLVRANNNYLEMMNRIIRQREAAESNERKDQAAELLTSEELVIYKMMVKNMKNTDIARQADMDTNTLKEVSRSIYKKFGVQNKKALIALAKETAKLQIDGANLIREHKSFEALTNREIEVCYLLGNGLSNVEISTELYISQNTVKTHVSRVYSKLGVSSKKELIQFIKETL